MTKRKIAEYKYTDAEIRKMARQEFHIDKPIRKDKKEKREYIKYELNSEFIKDVDGKADAYTKARIILLANSL